MEKLLMRREVSSGWGGFGVRLGVLGEKNEESAFVRLTGAADWVRSSFPIGSASFYASGSVVGASLTSERMEAARMCGIG